MEEKRIKLDKWNINYIKVGKGPHHVFFLPGALGSIWTSFRHQVEGFDRENFTLVVWDPPGYGMSRPPDKKFTIDYHTRDADYAFQFMKALGIPKYSLVGYSDGGAVALIHAAKYPDSVIKLVTVGASPTIHPEKLAYLEVKRDVTTWPEELRKNRIEIYGETLQDYWNRWMDRHEALMLTDNGKLCGHLLKDIKCPTYIFYAGNDKISPLKCAEELIANISGARSHMYPEGKHNIPIKYAEDFNKRVKEFLLEP